MANVPSARRFIVVAYDYDQGDWGAQRVFPDGGLPGLWVPDKWVIHYGGNASFGAKVPGDVQREMAALRVYEQSHLSRGWRAIGYNYAVGNSGSVYRLRGENPAGATSGDYEGDGIPENSEARAVLWIGGLGQEPTAQAYAAMSRLLNDDPLLLTVHSDHKSTNCPGDFWREWANDFVVDSDTMPKEQWFQMIDALFDGRPDEFVGQADYWKYDVPTDSPEWDDFWAAFVRAISLGA